MKIKKTCQNCKFLCADNNNPCSSCEEYNKWQKYEELSDLDEYIIYADDYNGEKEE